jgi:hypothetical protein
MHKCNLTSLLYRLRPFHDLLKSQHGLPMHHGFHDLHSQLDCHVFYLYLRRSLLQSQLPLISLLLLQFPFMHPDQLSMPGLLRLGVLSHGSLDLVLVL